MPVVLPRRLLLDADALLPLPEQRIRRFRAGNFDGAAQTASTASFEHEESKVRQLQREARTRFLEVVKTCCYAHFAESSVNSFPALKLLIEAASKSQDVAHRALNEWQEGLAGKCIVPAWYHWPLLPGLAGQALLERHQRFAVDLAFSFVNVHQRALDVFARIAPDFIVALIAAENQTSLLLAQAVIEDVDAAMPDLVQSFRTNLAVQKMLKASKAVVEELFQDAEIGARDVLAFRNAFAASRSFVRQRRAVRGDVRYQHQVEFEHGSENSEGLNADTLMQADAARANAAHLEEDGGKVQIS
jgi:hypothetical protein